MTLTCSLVRMTGAAPACRGVSTPRPTTDTCAAASRVAKVQARGRGIAGCASSPKLSRSKSEWAIGGRITTTATPLRHDANTLRRVLLCSPPRASQAGGGDSDAEDARTPASADDWITNWKAGNFPRAKGWKFGDPPTGQGTFAEEVSVNPAGPGPEPEEAEEQEKEEEEEERYEGDAKSYTYIFCHNLMSPPEDSFACMYLRDTLGAVGIQLVSPDLTGGGGYIAAGAGGAGAGTGDFTVTTALAALADAVAAAPADKPRVRIIGSSLGAYVAALYASSPEHKDKVDRVFLLAPTFKAASSLDGLERELGVTFSAAFKEDIGAHPEFPFVSCPAYVVHGYDDEAAPLEYSLTWVRDASVNMRRGAASREGEIVSERRLLEVGGMGHGIEDALPQVKTKLTEFFRLPFQQPERFE
mmetsp:Transcript_33714/g.82720  ORF Transcript_33714/g.82720 Transcript_33714/m.82720 type:complete len:415 (+) Transcript_33714:221-1465(+)|eukprot:CAMPEP_0197576928 /NCGR_PEP_ID=MMETSP1326-20131121/1748_1 /TAXON_ID=1155430 /ORGANISM="Genus nov. species nov., Strain RCC2288" /LENGTH=414 /DNA_ID=CAMNT_0043139911 /DNA_START=155 /DNA_END=1399 /DNA_ORIENTATION=+